MVVGDVVVVLEGILDFFVGCSRSSRARLELDSGSTRARLELELGPNTTPRSIFSGLLELKSSSSSNNQLQLLSRGDSSRPQVSDGGGRKQESELRWRPR